MHRLVSSAPTVPVDGSAPRPVASGLTPLADDARVDVCVLVRAASNEGMTAVQAAARWGPCARRYQDRDEHRLLHGASDADLRAVGAHGGRHGAVVVDTDRSRRTVTLSGPASALGAAFGVELLAESDGHGVRRVPSGPANVPLALAQVVEAVLGLDDRPVVAPRVEHVPRSGGARQPRQVLLERGLPPVLTGRGVGVAILEFDDAHDLSRSVQAGDFSLVAVPPPPAHGWAPGEIATLDAEIVAAAAPGARIAVYRTTPDERGVAAGLSAAVHDAVRRPSVILVSWAAPTSAWSGQLRRQVVDLLRRAAIVGATVCAAGEPGEQLGASVLTLSPLASSARAFLPPTPLLAGAAGGGVRGSGPAAALWAGLTACLVERVGTGCGLLRQPLARPEVRGAAPMLGKLAEALAHLDGKPGLPEAEPALAATPFEAAPATPATA
jgi:kumamolisin